MLPCDQDENVKAVHFKSYSDFILQPQTPQRNAELVVVDPWVDTEFRKACESANSSTNQQLKSDLL